MSRIEYFGNYYLYDGYCYHESFPEEWALSHRGDTGPKNCKDCFANGCVDNVFIGYCVDCAIWKYHGWRGRGFKSSGIEATVEDLVKLFPSCKDTNCYMEGVDIDKIKHPIVIDEPDGDIETSVLSCHFEGGYNDM